MDASVLAEAPPVRPPEPAAEKAPWQRMLTGDDAKRAAELEKKFGELAKAEKFAEAQQLAQQIVELRTRVQGADHWQTADARRGLDNVKRWERLSAAERTRLSEAAELNTRVTQLFGTGKFKEALPLAEKAVAIRREVLGEDHPACAVSLVNLGQLHQRFGAYAAARSCFLQALAIHRKVLGEEHPETAISYGYLAGNLAAHGKSAEADQLFRKALAIRRRALGEDHRDTATSYDHLAGNLSAQGKYAEAEPLMRKALAIRQKVMSEDHPDTATSYDSVAGNLFAQGKFAEADPLLRKALVIRQKTLGEDHPDTAQSYNNVAVNLGRQGKYPEAEPLVRKVLAIRQKTLGENHPVTALSYNNLAVNLNAQGKYAEAETLSRTALAIRQKTLGENHPETANSYDNLAAILGAQGKHAEAEKLVRKAMAIQQKVLGEMHPDTAFTYHHLAACLNGQGKYAEAEPISRKSLAIRQKALGETHPETAEGYFSVAVILDGQGQHAQAEPLHRKALAIRRKVLGEAHPITAQSYHSLALNLQFQGKFAEAEPLHRKALTIRQKALGEAHPETATSYDSLADNLYDQGHYAQADPLYRNALAIRQKVVGEAHPDTAISYEGVALNLQAQGQYAQAEPLLRTALAIRQKVLGEAHADTANSYDCLAFNLDTQGQHAQAEPLLRTALAIRRTAVGEAHPATAMSYSHVAANLNAQGRYAAAETMWRSAADSFEAARLRISFTGLDRATFVTQRSPLPQVTVCLARTHRATEAWKTWEASLARGLFDDVAARLARPLSEEERRREQELSGKMQLIDKQIAALLHAKEPTSERRQQIEELQKQRDAAVLELTQFAAELAQKHGPVAGQVYELPAIQKQLPADAALVGWIDLKALPKAADPDGEHWACIVRRRGAPLWVKLVGSGHKDAWTEADDQLAGKVRERFIQQAPDATVPWRELPGQLYAQRLAPLAKHLGATADLPAVRQLIILPSPALAGVPVEALIAARTDQQPDYTISYAPSGTLFAWLQEQRAKRSRAERPRLLALGDPVFAADEATSSAPALPDHGVLLIEVVSGSNAAQAGLRASDVILSYSGQELFKLDDLAAAVRKSSGAERIPLQVWRAGQTLSLSVLPGKLGVSLSKQPAVAVLRAERDFTALMQSTRGPAVFRLPGSGREVEAIASLFDRPDKFLRSQASEQQLDALMTSGRLKEYAYLHLATHGLLDMQFPLRSALILAQDDLPDPLAQALAGKRAYDGRLTAEQILRTWKLDADMVTLSACQTGLGKYQKGEGYLGFAQAVFVAGGRSVVLSLWQADDDATALLMTRFYQNLLGMRAGLDRPMPKAEALREAKEWLRGLTNKELVKQLAGLPRGELVQKWPAPAEAGPRPFGHPYYWAAFILIGDPQ
jgi:CHAT domain-containing protein